MSARREQLLAVVERDIQQDCADYLSLRGLMQELYSTLLKRDCGHIELLNRQVAALVETIGQRAERRSKALGAFRLELDGRSMQELFDSYPVERRTALQQGWQQLAQLVGQCQRLNERNGQLLAMHHDILSQLLGPDADHGLYGQQAY